MAGAMPEGLDNGVTTACNKRYLWHATFPDSCFSTNVRNRKKVVEISVGTFKLASGLPMVNVNWSP